MRSAWLRLARSEQALPRSVEPRVTVSLRHAMACLFMMASPALADPPEVRARAIPLTLVRDAVRRTMRPVLFQLARCYAGPPEDHPLSCGHRTTAILRVSADGVVQDARLESDVEPLDPRVSACVLETLRRTPFPWASRPYRVSYPIGLLVVR